jgi:hypothetical protein
LSFNWKNKMTGPKMRAGIILTVLYLLGVIGGPFIFGKTPSLLNEWGDYLAGFVAPVALGWFVLTLLLQRKELELQRKELELQRNEMELSRKVMVDQSAQQLRTAEATLEANKIAASNSFADRVPQYHEHLDANLGRMAPYLPQSINTPKGTLTIGKWLVAPSHFVNSINTLDQHFINVDEIFSSSTIQNELSQYLLMFREFETKANTTQNQVFIPGPYFDLAERFEKISNT